MVASKESALYRCARDSWYTLLESRPAWYFAWRRRTQPWLQIVDEYTDVVIEGREGCGNSFAREAMLFNNPGISVASHVHSSVNVVEGLRLRKPVIVLIRSPTDSVVSDATRFEDVDLRDKLLWFARFYEQLLPRTGEFVIASFDRVTSRFGDVIEAVNLRFGTSFALFPHNDPTAVEQVFATLVEYNRSLGIADGRAAVPSHDRAERAARVRAQLEDLRLTEVIRRSERVYARFLEIEVQQVGS